MDAVHRLSKSRFTSGLQCHRQLWWRVHEPRAPELVPDPAQQAIFDQGTHVGEVARERFPGGVLIDFPHYAYEQRASATQNAIQRRAPAIFEASLIADDTFVAVDVLDRDGGAWRLIEVKSSTKVKPEHLEDVAIQLHVLRASGLTVRRAEVMHLNSDCAFPDLSNLFTRSDVTAAAEALLPRMPELIRGQLNMLRGALPDVPIGPHCSTPYDCPFKTRCWPPRPEHHVSTLYSIGKRAWELEAEGYVTIDQLPDGVGLRAEAERQRRAIQAGGIIVEPGLRRALDEFEGPLAIIDFETVSPAIPVWDGCHPYEAVPAQFSCHAEDGDGGWTHSEWLADGLADGPADPRPELVRRLTAACQNARTIVAYNASYERMCLSSIAAALPALAAPIESILSRLVDALPLVRNHVYDPAFHGSFSLKAVLPALIPELGYEGLEIADGNAASREISRMLLDGRHVDRGERERLRAALTRYCALDTWAVVRLLERLRALA